MTHTTAGVVIEGVVHRIDPAVIGHAIDETVKATRRVGRAAVQFDLQGMNEGAEKIQDERVAFAQDRAQLRIR